jgi:beta-lactamase regulating signal transducer with metallopeptidase domain
VDVALNWLAQGAILTLAVAAGLRVIPRSRTRARYAFVWAAYLLLLVLPLAAPSLALLRTGATIDLAPAVPDPLVTVHAAWWTSATAALAVWIVWIGSHAVTLGRGLATAHDAKRRADACPGDLLARLPHWSRVSATGRPTRVVLSPCVPAAGVLGCGAPVIAIAPRLVERLSAADLDRVLVHEWAHVQRRDDLTHVIGQMARAIIGWHPAAWWLQRQLDFEREVACDEIAVRVTGSAKPYAACLLTIAALRQPSNQSVPVLTAVSRVRLRQRVERILAARCTAAVRPLYALEIGSGLGLLACALTVGHLQVVTSAVASAVAIAVAPTSARARDIVIPSTPVSLKRITPSSSSGSAGSRRSRVRVRPDERVPRVAEDVGKTQLSEDVSMTRIPSVPVPAPGEASKAIPFEPVASLVLEPREHAIVPAPRLPLKNPSGDVSAGWTGAAARAADVGVTIGRASQTAGVATAGFFRRFSKKIASSF